MPVPRRSFDPVIQLPKPRQSVHDTHHLFWPGADMRQIGLAPFRNIGCAKASRLDSMVHSVVHQRFSGLVSLRDAATLRDLRRLAGRAVEHHLSQHCACFMPSRLVVVDCLTLETFSASQYDRPPCLAVAVDGHLFDIMLDYYSVAAPVTVSVREELEARCDRGLCACYMHQGSARVFRPRLWDLIARPLGPAE